MSHPEIRRNPVVGSLGVAWGFLGAVLEREQKRLLLTLCFFLAPRQTTLHKSHDGEPMAIKTIPHERKQIY